MPDFWPKLSWKVFSEHAIFSCSYLPLNGKRSSERDLVAVQQDTHTKMGSFLAFFHDLDMQGFDGVGSLFPQWNDLIITQFGFLFKEVPKISKVLCGLEGTACPGIVQPGDQYMAKGPAIR